MYVFIPDKFHFKIPLIDCDWTQVSWWNWQSVDSGGTGLCLHTFVCKKKYFYGIDVLYIQKSGLSSTSCRDLNWSGRLGQEFSWSGRLGQEVDPILRLGDIITEVSIKKENIIYSNIFHFSSLDCQECVTPSKRPYFKPER